MNDAFALGVSADPQADGSERLWRTPLQDDPGFLLARVNALSLTHMHAALRELGLKARSYSLLAIAAADARPSQRELSEFLQLDPSQIVSLIDDLEGRGLVRREPDATDRRAKVVVATDAGRELATKAQGTVAAGNDAWFARIAPDDRDRLTEMLRTLATG